MLHFSRIPVLSLADALSQKIPQSMSSFLRRFCSIAVCIPAFHVDPVTDEARLIETAKKVCLSYSLGGILGGAILLASDDKE